MKIEIKYKIIAIIILSMVLGILQTNILKQNSIVYSVITVLVFAISFIAFVAAIWFVIELLFIKTKNENYKLFAFSSFWKIWRLLFILLFIVSLMKFFNKQ